jgi:predicted MFS family arabinose efflux permease
VLVLAAVGFLALAVELSPAGLLTRIAPDLGVGVASAGLLTALYSLGNAVLVLPLTALVLRFSRRAALAGALLVFVVGNVLVVLADGLGLAAAGRFLAGGAHGLLMAISPAVVVRLLPREQSGRALGLLVGGNTLGIALGAPLTSVIGTTFGWRTTFAVAAAVALVCALLLVMVMPDARPEAEHRVSLLRAVREPGVLRVGVAYALVMLAYMAVITYLDPFLERLGVPAFVVSLALFVFGVAGVAGVWVAGRLVGRSRYLGAVSMPVIMGVAYLLLWLHVGSVPVVLVLLAVWGIGFSGGVLVFQQSMLHVGHRAPETVMSLSVVLAQLGMAVGASLGGVVVDTAGVGAVPALGLVFVVVTVVLLAGLRRVLHDPAPRQEPDSPNVDHDRS